MRFRPGYEATVQQREKKMSFQQQLYDQIRDNVAPDKDFLLFKTAAAWDWQPNVGFVHPKEHQLVGTMPAPIGDEGPFYKSSGASIFNAYKTTLDSVDLEPSPEYEQKLKSMDDQIATAQAELQASNAKCKEAWKDSDEPDSKEDEWKEDNGWDVILQTKKDSLHDLVARRKQMVAASKDAHQMAMDALDDKRGFVKMIKSSGQAEEVPNFIVPVNGIEWKTQVAGGHGNRTSIHLTSSAHKSHTGNRKKCLVKIGEGKEVHKPVDKRLQFGHDVSYFSFNKNQGSASKDDFHGTNAQGMTNLLAITPQPLRPDQSSDPVDFEKDTTVNITFEALTLVNVTPDPDWYYPTYLNKVGQLGKWLNGRTNEDVFGPGGFHSVVTGFVAAYQPSFEISTTNTELRESLLKGSGFALGPIPIDTSRKDDLTPTEKTISVKSNSEYAQILGVCVQNPWAA